MEIDPEIADENVERDGRARCDEHAIGVVTRMIEVKRIAEAEIKRQSVELRDRPDRVHVDLRTEDDVFLVVHFGEIDVVVVFNADVALKRNRIGPARRL